MVREELDTATDLPYQRPGSGRGGCESSLERSRIAYVAPFPETAGADDRLAGHPRTVLYTEFWRSGDDAFGIAQSLGPSVANQEIFGASS